MISLDMVGYGKTFTVRMMGQGPRPLTDMLLAHAKATGVVLTYLREPDEPSGWSDHHGALGWPSTRSPGWNGAPTPCATTLPRILPGMCRSAGAGGWGADVGFLLD